MLYAEIYDDMGLYEKCVNGWFKYLDEAGFADLCPKDTPNSLRARAGKKISAGFPPRR